MRHCSDLRSASLLLAAACSASIFWGQAAVTPSTVPAGVGPVLVLDKVTSEEPLPNGVRVHFAGAVMEVTALRPDVVRVRVGRDGQMPEDASWAVLPEARAAKAAVTRRSDDAAGFATTELNVAIHRRTGVLRITDKEGRLVEEDLRPLEFHGTEFRLTKRMGKEEHFFGLGDKPGPLDRRNQAFTLWNSDMFGWQESTDPIYKSIPFFLSMNEGRATGVLMDNTYRSSFDFGKELRDAVAFGAPDGPVDYYVW